MTASGDKLRILQIIAGMDIGGAYGGAERFGVELSRHLDRRRFDVSVCAFWRLGTRAEQQWAERLKQEGIDVFFAQDRTEGQRVLPYLRGLRDLIRYCTPPVDIVHSQYGTGALLALALRMRGRARYAMRTVHTIPLEWGLGPAGWLLRQGFQHWLFPLTLDAEVGVSRVVAEALDKYPGARLPRKPCYMIYNGISMDVCTDPAPIPLHSIPGLKQGDLVIGSIGRLCIEKGYIHLIEALPKVLAGIPNARLVLVGDGYLRANLEQRAQELGLGDRVAFVGQREDAIPFLKRMDLFALTSISESLPTAVLESMACGVPVVAVNIPGARELIRHGETGWLVPPANPAALAQAIVQLLRDAPLREQLSLRARQWIGGFSMEAIADQYGKLYCRIAGEELRARTVSEK